MSKDVIHRDGEDVVVREDTAKAFRGVNWALMSIGVFVLVAAVLLVILFTRAASDGKIESPAQAANANTR